MSVLDGIFRFFQYRDKVLDDVCLVDVFHVLPPAPTFLLSKTFVTVSGITIICSISIDVTSDGRIMD